MHSDTATAALRDIAHHIELAGQYRDDPRTVYAVTRCLEIISEASRSLPDELNARDPAADVRNPSPAAPHPPAPPVLPSPRSRGEGWGEGQLPKPSSGGQGIGVLW